MRVWKRVSVRQSHEGSQHHENQTNTNTMKKIALITTLSLVALGGIVLAAVPVKCMQCNGTGWKGSYKCASCGGDGDIAN
jgi:DnaJ-class molecular chaperone